MLGVLVGGAVAFLLCLVGGAQLIALLRAHGIGQPIHEAVTQHAAKAGTPTMGGVALSIATPLAYVAGIVAIGARPISGAVTLVVAIVCAGGVGALDDFLKVRRGRNTLGLRERQKSILLLLLAVLVVVAAPTGADACRSPSLARCGPLPDVGPWVWALWVLAVVWLTTNSVNFTDGLDGLLAGCSVPPLTLLAAIAYWQHRHADLYHVRSALQIAIVLAAMAGGCLGLLWWSAVPAKVFMGETGSLAIGAALVVAALALRVELLIPIFGAVYVVAGLSSFAQRMWFKGTRRFRRDHQPQRLLRMAPLHHHFEVAGVPEPRIVVRYWILSATASAIAGAVYYADAVRVVR